MGLVGLVVLHGSKCQECGKTQNREMAIPLFEVGGEVLATTDTALLK
jgi:hypothetical protein